MDSDIPIALLPGDFGDREVSNGHLAVSFFEAFLWEDVIEVRDLRERVLRMGQMSKLLAEGLAGYEAEIGIFEKYLADGCPETTRDTELIEALNSIALLKARREE